MARFEVVTRFADKDIKIPQRATAHAAGYDLAAAEDIVIQPIDKLMYNLMGEADDSPMPPAAYTLEQMADMTKASKAKPSLVSTGLKIKLAKNEYLELLPRSSTPLKYWLVVANSAGIIDADYYNNPDNEGEIFLQLINLSPYPIIIKKGDFIGQGIIRQYYITEDDCAGGDRLGGFGSTH